MSDCLSKNAEASSTSGHCVLFWVPHVALNEQENVFAVANGPLFQVEDLNLGDQTNFPSGDL